MKNSTAQALIKAAMRLSREVGELTFGPPVDCVYHPLDYAWEPHRRYLERYGGATGRVVLVGMNPGPFGMAQTGVPFGEVSLVRDWMRITGTVRRPAHEHPKRPVHGFDCPRSEVSGARLWGWARARWQTPERFFASFFVLNYCPLVFMTETGRNLTPDKLPKEERARLFAACDSALSDCLAALVPRAALGVGAFAEARLRDIAPACPVGRILHPSPASPAANRDWAGQVEAELRRRSIALD